VRVWHFYHVWAAGAWVQPATEHFTALTDAGFEGRVTVGLVGPPEDRKVARDILGSQAVPVDAWAEEDEGFEQVTLSAIHRDLHGIPGEIAIFYAHTKGAHHQNDAEDAWRRNMTKQLIFGMPKILGELLGEYDTVGCYWMTPQRNTVPPVSVTTPFYGGNFWWATASYLRTLPPVGPGRYDAESWIGLSNPRAFDCLPGERIYLTNTAAANWAKERAGDG
jgi:hypothetical protein